MAKNGKTIIVRIAVYFFVKKKAKQTGQQKNFQLHRKLKIGFICLVFG